MNRWAQLSANELSVLEGVFWLHGPSRDVLSQRLAFSRTHANAVVAGLIEQGWLDKGAQRESSGGRKFFIWNYGHGQRHSARGSD